MKKSRAEVRIVCISDTHGFHRALKIPPGDIFIHAGDLLPDANQAEMLADFNDWLATLPFRHRIVIAGNHDWIFEKTPNKARKILTNAVYLEHSGVRLSGLNFWGCPVTPIDKWMAFAVECDKTSRKYWDNMPTGTDVLITHGPPAKILDRGQFQSSNQGSHELNRAVLRVKPRLHVFGHIHGGYGLETGPYGISFVNCASLQWLGGDDILLRPPVMVRLNSKAITR